MISASQADDPGSIPGSRTNNFSEDIKLDSDDSGAVRARWEQDIMPDCGEKLTW